jgi:hypothetical protein
MASEEPNDEERGTIEFVQRFMDEIVSTGHGKMGIGSEELLRIVREDPERSAMLCEASVTHGIETKQRGYLQLAVAVAGAYQAEFNDDTLSVLVEQRLAEAGITGVEPEMVLPNGSEEPAEPSSLPPIHFQVNLEQLRDGDIYSVVRRFSHLHVEDQDDLTQLASYRGRVFITFPIPAADSREVWQVPEVRKYVAKIAKSMPYFPYFLLTRIEFGMFRVYFGSLASTEADTPSGLYLFHDSVLKEVARALWAVSEFAELIGEDPEQACRDVLAGCPDDFVDLMMSSLEETRRDHGRDRPTA